MAMYVWRSMGRPIHSETVAYGPGTEVYGRRRESQAD